MTKQEEPHTHTHAREEVRPEQGPGYHLQHWYDGWQVDMWWSSNSTGGPTELRITTNDPELMARGITTGTLRSIPLADIARELKSDLQRLSREQDIFHVLEPRTDWAMRHIRQTVKDNPKPGRTGRPESFHLAIAVLYVWYVLMREPNPVQDLAEIVGADRRAAANWISLARKNGMLTEAAERQSGGTLTDKAVSLLKAMNESEETN
ncbi:hypothetical protein [Nonomuraea guangzhouensis]|uniref:Uncharacterized protein n=1 Tax=Nonomuraea guangzhouensis TaxID=1291555 RepID=A0ABW4GX66_9ACTN|nr:hypothetical protein [Nonomuraea guangzhouensis]